MTKMKCKREKGQGNAKSKEHSPQSTAGDRILVLRSRAPARFSALVNRVLCCVSIILCYISQLLCCVSQLLCCLSQQLGCLSQIICCVWQMFVACL